MDAVHVSFRRQTTSQPATGVTGVYHGYMGNDLRLRGTINVDSTVDRDGVNWNDNSIAVDDFGTVHIAYLDYYDGNLKYAVGNGTNWNSQIVDQGGRLGFFPSLALDPSGNPHIAYWSMTTVDRGLKYVRLTASGWTPPELVDRGLYGKYCSLAVDNAGTPHISYFDEGSGALKYATLTTSGWDRDVVDQTGQVGKLSSTALDAAGRPHISYQDLLQNDLKYVHWTGTSWSAPETVDSEWYFGSSTDIAMDAFDRPHIAYSDWGSGLRYAFRDGSGWHSETVGDASTFPYLAKSSIGLRSDGKPYLLHTYLHPQIRIFIPNFFTRSSLHGVRRFPNHFGYREPRKSPLLSSRIQTGDP